MSQRSSASGPAYAASPSYTRSTGAWRPAAQRAARTERSQALRWEETRTGMGTALSVATPILFTLGLAVLVLPWFSAGLGAAVTLWIASVFALLARLFVFDRRGDPALAIPVAALVALGIVAFIAVHLFIAPSAALVLALGIVVAAAGFFILSQLAVTGIVIGALAAFVVAIVRHGSGEFAVGAYLGLAAAFLVAGVAQTVRTSALSRVLKALEGDRRRDRELEQALQTARDAELDAKRQSESASAGLLAGRERDALRARLELILDNAREGIIGTDLRGGILFANRAAADLTGHPLDELKQADLHHLIHHSHADGSSYPDAACPVRAAIRDERTRHVEGEVFWRSDGMSFPVTYTASPLVEDGTVRGVIILFQDLTEATGPEPRPAAVAADDDGIMA